MYKGKEPKFMGGGCSRVSKASLGAILLVGFLWFIFVGISSNHSAKLTTFTAQSTVNLELLKLIARERRHAVRRDFGLKYVSKRRVPNGPDPIHNRRADKSRQSPDRT